MENTASWVDEKYGKLLAKQHRANLKEDTEGVDYDSRFITENRKDDRYLFEKIGVSNGFGVKKPVIRAYFLNLSTDSEMSIAFTQYTLAGKAVMCKSRNAKTTDDGKYFHLTPSVFKVLTLTYHAHSRLFERLRTNNKDDVVKVLKVLTEYAESTRIDSGDATLNIPSIGRFELVSVVTPQGKRSAYEWVVKTFIAEKK